MSTAQQLFNLNPRSPQRRGDITSDVRRYASSHILIFIMDNQRNTESSPIESAPALLRNFAIALGQAGPDEEALVNVQI